MIKPKRIQRKRTKYWRTPPNTVSVTRPGTWGNPHKVGGKITDFDAVAMFEDDLQKLVLKDKNGVPLLLRVHELRGKDVACFCREDDCCHGDILLAYANSTTGIYPWRIRLSADGQIIKDSSEDSGLQYTEVPSPDEFARYRLAEDLDVSMLEGQLNPPDELRIGGEWHEPIIIEKLWLKR